MEISKTFDAWLESLDTSENIIEHLKGQKSFHMRFAGFLIRKFNKPILIYDMKDIPKGFTQKNVEKMLKDLQKDFQKQPLQFIESNASVLVTVWRVLERCGFTRGQEFTDEDVLEFMKDDEQINIKS